MSVSARRSDSSSRRRKPASTPASGAAVGSACTASCPPTWMLNFDRMTRTSSRPISKPYMLINRCIMDSRRFSERVRTVESDSTNCLSVNSETSPVDDETMVPDASRCNLRTRLLSVSPCIASSNDWPFAAMATGSPLLRASDTALSLTPALRCPVTRSSSAAESMDMTASAPPFPSRSTNPSGSVAEPSA